MSNTYQKLIIEYIFIINLFEDINIDIVFYKSSKLEIVLLRTLVFLSFQPKWIQFYIFIPVCTSLVLYFNGLITISVKFSGLEFCICKSLKFVLLQSKLPVQFSCIYNFRSQSLSPICTESIQRGRKRYYLFQNHGSFLW